MQRLKNILVGCDESSDDAPETGRAMHLAVPSQAKVSLINMIAATPGDLSRLSAALSGLFLPAATDALNATST
ncbi:MAG: hypothetical protein ACSHXW_02500 [Yoonia sp.]